MMTEIVGFDIVLALIPVTELSCSSEVVRESRRISSELAKSLIGPRNISSCGFRTNSRTSQRKQNPVLLRRGVLNYAPCRSDGPEVPDKCAGKTEKAVPVEPLVRIRFDC